MFKALFGGSVPSISVQDYHEQYHTTKENHQIIDVRTKNEFSDGHVPNAINIPLDQLSGKMNKISKDRPVFIICASGGRSRSATQQLIKAGYDNVTNVQGGTMRWQMAGYPISNKK